MLFAPSGKKREGQKKGEKGRFRPISWKGGQTPLKPPFVTPPFAAAQVGVGLIGAPKMTSLDGKTSVSLSFNCLRHVMKAILSARPECPHRCVSLKRIPTKPVQILKHTAKNSTGQTSMREKWFKHIAL